MIFDEDLEKQEYINEEDYFYLKSNSSDTPHSFGYFIHQLINKEKFDLVNKLFHLPEIFPRILKQKVKLHFNGTCPKK